eukprot:TRINITY_DN126_c0_g2_i1.p1 TRINITY_DN126_c0_g2~~TRINITY_DN126_c0_g2_i1.p1  ORF type:complete len:358 (-),score=174.12 TRINITY_DN126_c0_g2_i1:256-1329(-)
MGDVYERAPGAHNNGGYHVTDQKALDDQRGVVWDLIKQLGKAITEGQPLTKIAIPVQVAEPRTYLERICDGWCYPSFLQKAAECEDPVERLKNVVAFAISGLSNTTSPKKPFNPIVGETYQATFDDGTQIFCEQSTHHPPITNWEVVGPENCYKLYGYGELMASIRGNSVKGKQAGPHFVEFNDGGLVEYHLPDVWIRGIMFGDRIIEYDGDFKVFDRKNNLFCKLTFNPDSNAWFWSAKRPNDHYVGAIYKYQGDNPEDESKWKKISDATGSWLGCVVFEKQSYWNWDDDTVQYKPIPVDDPLPSDARFREDVNFLKDEDLENAAEWKKKLEVQQRNEAKLRKEYAAANNVELRED